ncbi:RNA polymerase sigma factor [Roseateles saccharophilus]|uniref:RNA polymerase sigma-70 factor (ECF subfamily) n=1 Tax=Roseateles saccharophilus TaxID=304 RepID=A0A4R3U4M2_ROSSA|nr:RNA polymerase sigma factor [Roseateles saccharophilus]MDG0836090.1 RNA polymerase sigma factor [Roseateles saccharophilus]TCU81951.1 RNA polymerase sigma-70 factor (ECF subfamily) [Roseateles saccharophilus]
MDIKKTFASVRAALLRRGSSAQDADDLVQEAWVRLAGYQREQEVAQPEAFMMRTALNLSIDVHRARMTRGCEVLVEDAVIIDLAPTAEDSMLAKERVARLSAGLARLSETSRAILLSHRLDGLTYGEIARARGVSVSTVHIHVAKATLQLTSWMEDW